MPRQFTTSDLDLDSDQDLIVSGSTTSGNIKILKNLGNGTFNIESDSKSNCMRWQHCLRCFSAEHSPPEVASTQPKGVATIDFHTA